VSQILGPQNQNGCRDSWDVEMLAKKMNSGLKSENALFLVREFLTAYRALNKGVRVNSTID
jgi:hypothetical protein